MSTFDFPPLLAFPAVFLNLVLDSFFQMLIPRELNSFLTHLFFSHIPSTTQQEILSALASKSNPRETNNFSHLYCHHCGANHHV